MPLSLLALHFLLVFVALHAAIVATAVLHSESFFACMYSSLLYQQHCIYYLHHPVKRSLITTVSCYAVFAQNAGRILIHCVNKCL